MILIDEPQWPAHGVRWAHLVSDVSLTELHDFARRVGLPARSFDLDHYDVPEARHGDLVEAGALAVPRRDLVRRLARSGLRVPGHARAAAKRQVLAQRWENLLPGYPRIGSELLDRWHEPHRVYHGPAHLKHALDSLALLTAPDAQPTAPGARETVVVVVEGLALWFHDAVHTGGTSASQVDEEKSAQLALDLLGPLTRSGGPLSAEQVAEVARLVLVTKQHNPDSDDAAGARVSDADLAILASAPDRYAHYVAQVRAEYAHGPDDVFNPARAQILRTLLQQGPIFRTRTGSQRWEANAQSNLCSELEKTPLRRF